MSLCHWIFFCLGGDLLLNANLFLTSLSCAPVPIPGGMDVQQLHLLDPLRQTALTDYAGFNISHPKGEGYHDPTLVVGADDGLRQSCINTANSGKPLPEGYGPPVRPPITQVHKRSFLRACRRALRCGSTGYHGKTWHWTDFPRSLISKVMQQQQPTTQRGSQVSRAPGSRYSVLHWNPGGFSRSHFLELKWWLRENPVDLVILSETRWSFDHNWYDDHWSYLHSAAPDPRTGGLLVMVSTRIARPQFIGYDSIEPGRLMHVRLHFESRAVDLLAVYQHVCQRTTSSTRLRASLWQKLDDSLARLPTRNLLICVGDFNCNIPEAHPWTGPNSFRWRGRRIQCRPHSDHQSLLALLKRHHLVALNTWNEKTGPTFVHSDTATKIDYILTRISSCDGAAKDAKHLRDADIIPINQTHHIPVRCTIRTCHTMFRSHPQMTSCSYQQRALCRHALLQDSSSWTHLQQTVSEALTSSTSVVSPDEVMYTLHAAVTPNFHALFPKPHRIHPDRARGISPTICTKWEHKRAAKKLQFVVGPMTQHMIFQVWHHWSRYCTLQREQKKQVRRQQQERFRELCQEVHTAANRHDAHAMFQIINKYSNKKPMLRTKLRTPEGHIADQYQAHSMTADFVSRIWRGPAKLHHAQLRAPGVPFSEAELALAISAVHMNKSVAQPFLPGVVWKGAPHEIARFLMQHLRIWWSQTPPVIPQCWRDSWLFFLPKPGKPNTHPEHLRPISLMEPLGSIIMGLLTTKLKICLQDHLCQFPHFGFLPRRAATDAINRVALHCRTIRALVANGRRTVANQMTGLSKMVIGGGVSLFLDLTRAFDAVDRNVLFTHLANMHPPDHLLSLIRTWHEHTHYNLLFQGNTYPIPIGRGVRQGCKIAPLLWLVYMDCFLQQLIQKTGPEWVMTCLTLYADDLHIGCQFSNLQELKLHLYNLGCVLDVLESLHMTLSYTKSFMLMSVSGTNPRAALKGIVHRSQKGTQIRLPREGQYTDLPLHNTGSYLGVVMSYKQFEVSTWHRRRQAGWSAFQRMQCWLKAKTIPMNQRLFLWHTCIFTVLTYGLLAVQLTPQILHDYQSVVFRMLRSVIGDHSYCTHHTHQQALQSHGVSEPLDLLCRLAMRLHERLGRRALLISSQDVLHQVDWSHLSDTLHLIQNVHQQTAQVTISADPATQLTTQAVHCCPYCSIKTTSLANLRRHMTTQHHYSQLRTFDTNHLATALHGRPQCSNCHRCFTTWRSYIIHIQRDCCQVSMQRTPDPLTLPTLPVMTPDRQLDQLHVASQPFWPTLKHLVSAQQWTGLGPEPDIGEHLTHSCMVCGLWMNRYQEMHSHYRLHHSELFLGGVAKGVQLSSLMGTGSPCILCSAEYQRVHSCPVTLQIGVLHILTSSTETTNIATRCDICM